MRGHGMSDLQLAAHLNALADGPAHETTARLQTAA
jgi:hypothetical protein